MTPPSLHTTTGSDSLLQNLSQLQAAVREQPTVADLRWSLIETLCLLCQWDRALQQLQTWVRLEPEASAQAHALRGLIRAEAQRMQVFSGITPAAPVIEFTPWMNALWLALQHNSRGQHAQADTLRESALAQAPTHAGQCQWQSLPQRHSASDEAHTQTHAFDWLGDSDTRLGPICEVMVSGAYRWLPFADIASLDFSKPRHRMDVIWRPARLTLREPLAVSVPGGVAPVLHVFIPARSCWLETPTSPDSQQQALLQARLTVWHEQGQTGVMCVGQKTWMSDGMDWPVLDVRHVDCTTLQPSEEANRGEQA